jgi:hypothetical protein
MKTTTSRVLLNSTLILTVFLSPAVLAETGVATSGLFSMNPGLSHTEADGLETPSVHQVGRVYPNPFNPSVTIECSLAAAASLEVGVYDLRGRLVRQLAGGEVRAAGPVQIRWDGKNGEGRTMAGGVYLCRLQIGEQVFHRRLTMLK